MAMVHEEGDGLTRHSTYIPALSRPSFPAGLARRRDQRLCVDFVRALKFERLSCPCGFHAMPTHIVPIYLSGNLGSVGEAIMVSNLNLLGEGLGLALPSNPHTPT